MVILKENFSKQGRVYPEWALKLKVDEQDWFPVPALTYVSYERLGKDWMLDEFCPIAPEFIVEIVEKGQQLDAIVAKVANYLKSGVLGVCLVNTYSHTVTISTNNHPPKTFTGEMIIENQFLSGLNLTATNLFKRAGFF